MVVIYLVSWSFCVALDPEFALDLVGVGFFLDLHKAWLVWALVLP